MPADDFTDPAPATTFAHLDATTVLSRALTEIGIYPAVDPLASTSRILTPAGGRRGALRSAQGCEARCCSATRICRTSSPSWGWTSFLKRTSSYGEPGAQSAALSVAAVPRRGSVYRRSGKYVKVGDTVRSFKEIIEGKHDDIPEQAFYMKGTIDEVLEAAKNMKDK